MVHKESVIFHKESVTFIKLKNDIYAIKHILNGGFWVPNILFLHFSSFLSMFCLKTSSPKGNDRSPESNVPRSICPKTLWSLSPTPMMLHTKFDQDWPTGFRDVQVQKCEIFVTQGQVIPKWVVWFGPKLNSTKLLCLPWLQADDSNKNERASM